MGVWDKDKAFAPDGQLNEFAPADSLKGGTKFILYAVELIEKQFETELGTAPMIHLTVATLEAPDTKLVVSSIGDTNAGKFFDKDNDYASKIEDGDLPAIVETRVVPASQETFSDAFVIRFVEAFNKDTLKKQQKEQKKKEEDVPF